MQQLVLVLIVCLFAFASNAVTETVEKFGESHFLRFWAKRSAKKSVTQYCASLGGVAKPESIRIVFCLYPSSSSAKSHCLASCTCIFEENT